MAKERMYIPAEIEAATGIARHTLKARAKKLGYDTSSGDGYTFAQVLEITKMPLLRNRVSKDAIVQLRNELTKTFRMEDIPLEIVQDHKGKSKIERI